MGVASLDPGIGGVGYIKGKRGLPGSLESGRGEQGFTNRQGAIDVEIAGIEGGFKPRRPVGDAKR